LHRLIYCCIYIITMIDYQSIKEAPLVNLDFFSQWGALPWQKFLEIGIGQYLGKDLSGKKILEIGPGIGRVTSLLAILGGDVTAIDVKQSSIDDSQETVKNFGVAENVKIIKYDGNLDILGDEKFDIVFTKSVLIYSDDLRGFLEGVNDHLKADGKVVFIENAKGNVLLHLARWIKRHSISFFKRTHYFTQTEIDLVKSIFNIELAMHSKFPPVLLFCGKKK
jgi:2-polyprenyl-3-methyl-5-hydroxy-6-metoxy-1,4-benzoquinol methylase